MGVSEAEFYDTTRVAVIPMGFCFPGQDAKGADLPPRPECAPLWRRRLLGQLDRLELVLLAGQYAIAWHLGRDAEGGLTAAVARWREHLALRRPPLYVPLPHPSWRNNAWIARNPWFEAELLPRLRQEVRRVLDLEV
jgi:uracil-DNA glycosylase